MGYNLRTDVTQEEIDQYQAVATAYVKETKGWEPKEYRIRFIAALADAPLAAFNVIHLDGLKAPRDYPAPAQRIHPLELEVYVKTDEMRAFGDNRDWQRIIVESRKKALK